MNYDYAKSRKKTTWNKLVSGKYETKFQSQKHIYFFKYVSRDISKFFGIQKCSVSRLIDGVSRVLKT